MATDTDIQEYKSYDEKGKIVKTATIKGEEGKQIKIEAVSLQLCSGKEGVTNNTVVSINGTPYAAWNYTSAIYSDVLTYNKYPFMVDAGKDAIITWALKTSDKRYVVKAKNAAYTYEYVDVAVPDEPNEPEGKNPLVVIECVSSDKAKEVAKEIQDKGIITDDMKLFIAESV